jgi:holo-[acyl-carrier protein] synthase
LIIGTGIDIVEVARLRKIIAGKSGTRFIERVFTEEERRFCLARKDPAPHLAARFAAKEAVFKALGTGWARGASWLEAQVRRKGDEAPTLLLSGATLALGAAKGVGRIHLSLTHAGEWAAATVILE